VLALVFAAVAGMNDGASVLSMALRAPSVAPGLAVLAIVAAVVMAPFVVGTEVATTLAARLVDFGAETSSGPMLAALAAAVAVVAVLARRGLPTSVALALVGGVVGAGVGYGLPVEPRTIGLVLAVAAASPVVGGVFGWGLARLTVLMSEVSGHAPSPRRVHLAGFGLLAFAYGANGGQKMLAVVTLGLGVREATVAAHAGRSLLAGGAFAVGLLLGLRRVAGSLGTGVMVVRATHAANTEVAAATAVLASTALGAPVSLTQVTAAALVGSGVSERRQIRWDHAGRIAAAWALTLPAALVLGAAGGWLATLRQ
jgi:PiT family inorganic phosphate transporter